MEKGWIYKEKRGGLEADEEKWVYDSSVDHKGKVPLRASTGVWRASRFIIMIEFGERLSYFGLSANLIIYLTGVLHQEVKTAAKNVNFWVGVTTMMPLIGGFIADAYLGRFNTVFLSSLVYLMGLGLLTLSQFVPSLKPCNTPGCNGSLRVHEGVFFAALYLISIGTGGHKPSLESFGADQFDEDHAEERRKKMSYFNWWNCALCCGLLLGVTGIVYIEDDVSWGVADIVLTSIMAIGLVIFVVGRPLYRYRAPEGSPFIPILQVLVAAVAKRHLSQPSDAGELYETPKPHESKKRLLSHTNQFRFLDKAAIIEYGGDHSALEAEKRDPWRLATVTQVEEMKLVLAMMPIWLACVPFGICAAQPFTFYTKQGSTMNRRVAGGFEIPPGSVSAIAAIGMIISVSFYDKILVPSLRRATGNERGMSILQRIGIGMVFSVQAMAVAALVERMRLRLAHEGRMTPSPPHGVVDMSVFWLAPQFLILGFGDGFTLVGLQEYFYDQVPDGMRSLGIAFYLSVIGIGNFASGLLIALVDRMTQRSGHASWFATDLNKSRLDNFYWLLAALSGVNIGVYVYLARRYSYKVVQRKVSVANAHNGVGDYGMDASVP